jgi:outer membrane murein-binding lipoprotein Lpp
MKKHVLALTIGALLSAPQAFAQDSQTQGEVTAAQVEQLLEQMQQLQQRVAELEQQLAQQQAGAETQQEANEATTAVVAAEPRTAPVVRQRDSNNRELRARLERLEEEVDAAQNAPIEIGGAVRAQYVWEDYNDGNKDRGGDFDFDLLRIDFRGEIGDVILSAQYRWFQYMESVQHAWVGYNFDENWQGQLGITKVPFGVTPYNSNSYFFSTNFYVGLEDDHDAGVKLRYRDPEWDFDIAFFKNDESGGVDGFTSAREDRYAYDPLGVRLSDEGIYDTPTLQVAEANSFAARVARKYALSDDSSFEWGLSGQFGQMNDGIDNVGDRYALAAHGVYSIDRWTFTGQFTQYEYDMDMANEGIVVGAYAFYDTIPAKADLYNFNIAYSLPVQLGPITNLTFYNDYNVMTNKTGDLEDTIMNVLGVAVSAGGLYTYFDLVTAKNQPFAGGTLAGNSSDYNTRFNINIGYYF